MRISRIPSGRDTCAAQDFSTAEPNPEDCPASSGTVRDLIRQESKRAASYTAAPRARSAETGNRAAPASAGADSGGRVKRGPVLSACISDRGGKALAYNAIASERFDQGNYLESRGQASGGLCEGMVFEAMRRLDRGRGPLAAGEQSTLPLMAAVHDMHAEAAQYGSAREPLFARIQGFQNARSSLGFTSYIAQPSINLHRPGSRETRIAYFLDQLKGSLQHPNDMAYVQLSLESSTGRGDYGHAILVQRGADNHYSIFDPNNGAFEYADWRDTAQALEEYMLTSFRRRASIEDELSPATGSGYEVVPFKMQVYLQKSPVGATQSQPAPIPTLSPRPGPAGYGPPEAECDDQIYQEHAQSWSSVAIDALFPHGTGSAGLRSPAESMGSYVLQEVAAGGSPDLLSATNKLGNLLNNSQTRTQTIADLNARYEPYQSASATIVRNHTRHGGTLQTGNEEDLVSDLWTHFSETYIGEGEATRFHNDLAVIDMALGYQVPGASSRDPSRPIIVQRLMQRADFSSDDYQLYDPYSGVYVYHGFEDMSAAVRRIYNSGYSDEGGIGHATTTWYAGAAGVADTTDEAWRTQPLSVARNITLDGAENAVGHVHHGGHVQPLPGLPAEPDDNRPSLRTFVQRTDLKRAAGRDSLHDPWVLFRPSTDTPDQVRKRGGFSASATPLRDVNLLTHNFDIASHRGETDSAGYLGTFDSPAVAIERQENQSAEGYIYALAPSPNMVDVNASLGPHAFARGQHEFAAMGYLDATQIIGWWRTSDLKDRRFGEFVPNPDYRWDVYGRTRTAGTQPQLARFKMNDPAWQEAAYQPFSLPRGGPGRQGLIPKGDPNLRSATFYLDAMLKIDHLANQQSAGKDYRGPMVLRAYGGDGRYILYADGQDNPTIYKQSYADGYPDFTTQFAMGSDGRFHYAKNYNKILRVGYDGYLYVGTLPKDPWSKVGMFRFDGSRLRSVEDSRYLTVGKTVYTPFVTDYDAGYRSSWLLTKPAGGKVMPPTVNENSFSRDSDIESRRKLYRFSQDPESILPPGTTQFVTQGAADVPEGTLAQSVDFLKREGYGEFVIETLTTRNAAWIFRDGFYAVPLGRDRLEIRTIAGKPVWQLKVDLANDQETWTRLDPNPVNFTIDDDLWQNIKTREYAREDLREKLMRM